MNYIIRASKEKFQNLIDKISGKKVDIVGIIGYSLALLGAIHSLYISLQVLKYPVLKNIHSSAFYTFFIAVPILTFHITMAGDYLKKPSRRAVQFAFVILTTTIFALSYIIQIANTSFLGMLKNIKNIEVIPYSLLEGNIRIISFFIPCAIVLPIALLTFKMIFDKDIRKDLIEYEVDFLLPRVHKMNETTIDIKLCEDLETGEDCILPEKNAFEHIFLQGGTGSGKTATYIRPFLGQLFYMKAYLREMQKGLAYEALEEGIAYLVAPITNVYFKKNFTMDIIKPVRGKEEEFKNKFKNAIIGTRDKEVLLLNKDISEGELSFKKPKGNSKCIINITIFEHGLELVEKEEIIEEEFIPNKIIIREDLKPIELIEKVQGGLSVEVKNEKGEVVTPKLNLAAEDTITMKFPALKDGYKYKVNVTEKGTGEIIYKGCGVTVVAPDGGLPKDTLKIAREYGVRVHKIDPTKEEIDKGGIAKFNPLLGDSPEKTGDIISSILVSMEQTSGQDSNPYFTNASVRAVRNITILLKVMYPRLKGINPTLHDILDILNNFNLVVPLINEMKKDDYLRKRWSSVISYFETSFFPPETDDKGKPISGATVGSQRKKTEEAIGGIINQLDNFLGREEIKYIFCDREKSLDLAKVLEKGDCIAIATRQNDLGEIQGKAFALFFILSMQNAVLSRYSEDENPEIPHYLVIDEFPFYVNDSTKVFFTFARKYKCSVTVAIQNMAQLREVSDIFRETIFTNTSTKMLLPKSNVEDREYWSKFLGIEEVFELQTGVTQGSLFTAKPSYSESIKGSMVEKARISEQNINDMNFKQAYYCYTDAKGRQKVGKGLTDFLRLDDTDKIEIEEYDFEKFNRETIEQYNARRNQKKEAEKLKNQSINSSIAIDNTAANKNTSSFEPIVSSKGENIKIETIDMEKIELEFESEPAASVGELNELEQITQKADVTLEDKNVNMQVIGVKRNLDFNIDEIELDADEEDIEIESELIQLDVNTMELEEVAAANNEPINIDKIEIDFNEDIVLDPSSDINIKTEFANINTNEASDLLIELDYAEEVISLDKSDKREALDSFGFNFDFDIEIDFEVKGTEK